MKTMDFATLMPSFGPLPVRGDEKEFRGLCLRCLRATSVCYCAEIRTFRPSFDLVILQHPRERRNAIGTARMTHLCVENSKLIPGVGFESNSDVNAVLDSPDLYPVVLFPGENAINISIAKDELFARVAETTSASTRRLCIFAIDGTWSQARSMLRASPRLDALPKISFTPEGTSQYRVRRQPKPICLSTIESVHRVIQILDPSEKAKNLLQVFGIMVEAQVKCAERGRLRENFVPRVLETTL